jgi:hypothetical protein
MLGFRRTVVRLLYLLTLILGCASVAGAQSPAGNGSERRSIPAMRLEPEERITVDGLFDEPAASPIRTICGMPAST